MPEAAPNSAVLAETVNVLSQGQPRALLTVEEQTPLLDVVKLIPDEVDALLLVTDCDHRVIGAVSGNEIVERLQCDHEMERRRWQQMPVGSLMPVRIPTAFTNLGWVSQLPEGGGQKSNVSSFVCGGDIYISWRKLAPELRTAFRDRLTGIPNRAGMEFHLEQDWQRAKCAGQSLAMMIVDLDHFKDINDTHGHVYADGVLREVALALKSSVRSYDAVTRFGGDEFVIICVGCGMGEIEIPLRRMLNGVRDVSSDAGGLVDVSASIGAAICIPDKTNMTPVQLLQAADDCLYHAKEDQRGCAYVSDLTSGFPAEQRARRVDATISTPGACTSLHDE